MNIELTEQEIEMLNRRATQRNDSDLLRLWRMQEEQRRLDEIRSFYRAINYGMQP